jgi:hypothetical protein
MASFGLDLDRRIISVVQLGGDEVADDAADDHEDDAEDDAEDERSGDDAPPVQSMQLQLAM